MAKQIIGRNERIDLPGLRLKSINSKIDTGAFASALHCHEIKVVRISDKRFLKFKMLDPNHPKYHNKSFKFAQFSQKQVKNSFGQSEKRYVIVTNVKIFDRLIETEFSLTNRTEMKYPVLLGRKFIKQGFLVDVTKSNLSAKYLKKKIKSINNNEDSNSI